jgi:prepilin-type N-terminal cleavage/methylation domain-containing protein
MKHKHPQHLAAHRGFTLIETIIVMVILGIGAAAIVSLQGNIFQGQSGNQNMQVGVQLMQECAEQVLAIRRNSGYTAVTTSACSNLGNYGGFGTPSVTLKNDSNASVTACASTTCTATITISNGGPNMTPITLRLANYEI